MKVLIIRLLEACNAGCFMCNFAFSKDSYRFSVDDAITLCQEVTGSDLRLIRYTGGEPLLLKDFANITQIFVENGYFVSTITNGWYLQEKTEMLSTCGISQVVISIDGSRKETHDRYRRLPGLFDRCKAGIKRLKHEAPHVIIRVNSVIGQHNINELLELYHLLDALSVDQWSIIPLKRSHNTWEYKSISELKEIYHTFQQLVMANSNGPRLLGHSLHWAGRDINEFEQFVYNNRAITPNNQCQLVDHVRYYTPKDGFVYPCNCVPHRIEKIKLGEMRSPQTWTEEGLLPIREWLRKHGPNQCNGCEPINAALGEGAIDLEFDIFGF